jgi:hypothetical protein
MERINTLQFGSKLLSLLWLISISLLGISPTTELEKSEQTFLESKSDIQAFDVKYLLTENSRPHHPFIPTMLDNWLSLVPETFVESFNQLQFESWPEESLLNSYQSIVRYQYYISSLRTLF